MSLNDVFGLAGLWLWWVVTMVVVGGLCYGCAVVRMSKKMKDWIGDTDPEYITEADAEQAWKKVQAYLSLELDLRDHGVSELQHEWGKILTRGEAERILRSCKGEELLWLCASLGIQVEFKPKREDYSAEAFRFFQKSARYGQLPIDGWQFSSYGGIVSLLLLVCSVSLMALAVFF